MANTAMTTSIIIGSYNQLRTMRLLLASLDRQTYRDFEVVVADDGSSDGTAELCTQKRTFPLEFLTQPDLGYRKSKILNQAIRAAKSDYLIFVDGDIILEKHFIEDHIRLRKPNHFVAGRRVELGPVLSGSLSTHDIHQGDFDQLNLSVVKSALQKDTLNLKRGLRIRHSIVRKLLGYNRPLDLLGSNFSAWKADLEEVNGFNEALESYWGEDGDLFVRLRNSGKKSVGAKSLCVQYHVFHPRRDPNPETQRKYQELVKNVTYRWAEKGIR